MHESKILKILQFLSGHHGIGKDFHAFPGLPSSGDDLTDEIKRENFNRQKGFLFYESVTLVDYLAGSSKP